MKGALLEGARKDKEREGKKRYGIGNSVARNQGRD